jgi:hypothetical protein
VGCPRRCCAERFSARTPASICPCRSRLRTLLHVYCELAGAFSQHEEVRRRFRRPVPPLIRGALACCERPGHGGHLRIGVHVDAAHDVVRPSGPTSIGSRVMSMSASCLNWN